MFRMLLIPVFMAVYLSDMKHAGLIAGCVFLLAAVTDVLDGYIARKYDKITKLGRVLDPLADKLLQCSALLCLYLDGTLPLWPLLLFIGKELATLIGGAVMLGRFKDVISSNVFGKAATFVMSLAIFTLIVFTVPADAALYIVIAAFALLILALLSYTIPFFKTMIKRDGLPK